MDTIDNMVVKKSWVIFGLNPKGYDISKDKLCK